MPRLTCAAVGSKTAVESTVLPNGRWLAYRRRHNAHDQQLVNLHVLSPIIYANPCFAEALGSNRFLAETPEITALILRERRLA